MDVGCSVCISAPPSGSWPERGYLQGLLAWPELWGQTVISLPHLDEPLLLDRLLLRVEKQVRRVVNGLELYNQYICLIMYTFHKMFYSLYSSMWELECFLPYENLPSFCLLFETV